MAATRSKRLVINGQLWCPRCETHKLVEDFPRKGRHRDNTERYGYCKPCHSSYQREKKLERIFNITAAEYEIMLAHQGGVCAICGRPPGKARLSIDHDHNTGLVRGLICSSCNHALGYWKDSAERLQVAVDYLTTPPASEALGGDRYGRKGCSQTSYSDSPFRRGRS